MEYRRAAFNRRYLTVMESPHFHVRKGLQQITPNHRMSNFVELHSGQSCLSIYRVHRRSHKLLVVNEDEAGNHDDDDDDDDGSTT